MTLVTAIAEGKYPKYFGDCHNITPGSIFYSASFITSSIGLPFSGACYCNWDLKNPG